MNSCPTCWLTILRRSSNLPTPPSGYLYPKLLRLLPFGKTVMSIHSVHVFFLSKFLSELSCGFYPVVMDNLGSNFCLIYISLYSYQYTKIVNVEMSLVKPGCIYRCYLSTCHRASFSDPFFSLVPNQLNVKTIRAVLSAISTSVAGSI